MGEVEVGWGSGVKLYNCVNPVFMPRGQSYGAIESISDEKSIEWFTYEFAIMCNALDV